MKNWISVLKGMLCRDRIPRKHVGWGQVERRFARDAEIVVFACKAAVSETLLRDVAEYFDVTVKASQPSSIPRHLYRGKAVITETRSRWMGREVLTTLVQQLSKPEPKNPFW
jgi:hypothetical protein